MNTLGKAMAIVGATFGVGLASGVAGHEIAKSIQPTAHERTAELNDCITNGLGPTAVKAFMPKNCDIYLSDESFIIDQSKKIYLLPDAKDAESQRSRLSDKVEANDTESIHTGESYGFIFGLLGGTIGLIAVAGIKQKPRD